MQNTSKKIERVRARIIAFIAIILVSVLVIPTQAFAASGLSVSMQTSAASGAHSDTIYTFQISFTKPVIEKVDLRATLRFDDGAYTKNRPSQVTVYCGYGNEPYKYRTTISISNDSSVVKYDVDFNGLNKTDSDGQPINYVVSCNEIEGYTLSVSGTTITFVPRVLSVEVDCLIEGGGSIPCSDRYSVKYNDSVTITAPAVDSAYELISDSVAVLNNVKENYRVTFRYRLKAALTDPGSDVMPAKITVRPSTSAVTADHKASKPAQIVFLATNEQYTLPADKQQEAGLTSDGGSYTFRRKAGESWSISGLRDDLSYTIRLTGATLNGKPVSVQTNYFTINGAKTTSMSGTISGSPALVIGYNPPAYQVRIFHKDIDTNMDVANSETVRADQNGNVVISAKNDITGFKPVAPDSKAFTSLTADQTHTFYYQSTVVPEGEIKIVGQILWEEYDSDAAKRPATVDVELLQNGKVADTRTINVNDEDHQSFSFGNWPENDSRGKTYEYTVRQQPATITGYIKAEYAGNTAIGFTIQNKQKEVKDNTRGGIFSTGEDNAITLPIGSLSNNVNSSLFNVAVSAACGVTAATITVSNGITSVRYRKNPSKGKVQRNKTFGWVSVALGVIMPATLFSLEDFGKPMGVFNASSIFFIPLLLVFIAAVMFFGFSRPKLLTSAGHAHDNAGSDSTVDENTPQAQQAFSTKPANVYPTATYVTRTISSELEVTNRKYKKEQEKKQKDLVNRKTQEIELQKVVLSSTGVLGLTGVVKAGQNVNVDKANKVAKTEKAVKNSKSNKENIANKSGKTAQDDVKQLDESAKPKGSDAEVNKVPRSTSKGSGKSNSKKGKAAQEPVAEKMDKASVEKKPQSQTGAAKQK